MKTKFYISRLVTGLMFLGFLPVKTVALNYTISFTGSGASSTVENVTVHNLTQGTLVTVPAGNVLNLSDAPNAVKQVSANYKTMSYMAGDWLLYKGISGNYSTIVTDMPTGSKTTNFNFVACKDADGNNYIVVTIGTQTWMAENLKTTQYNDGTAIPLVTDNTIWRKQTTPCYCWYNNDATSYKNTYGALYNWYTVNTGKLAPTGWHVPTDAEWVTLENYLTANGYNYDNSTSMNKYAKSLATTINWATSTDKGVIGNYLSKNNSTGFSALPGGCRDTHGFLDAGSIVNWWSSSEDYTNYAWSRNLYYNHSDLIRSFDIEVDGFSVRCVRDN
jgi:uncharacterized protein (TIGR02145 family)